MNVGEAVRPRLVVGLGNPGADYDGTRHNVGFEVVDRVAARFGADWRRKWRFAARVTEAALPSGDKVVLAKPLTYMNGSGKAVAPLMKWWKISPAELLVVMDDVDLPLGGVKLRLSGSSGGHRGLASIMESLGGTGEIARLRIGIGRVGVPGADVTNHVLGRFAPRERELAEQAVATAVDAVVCSVVKGWTAAMNEFNRKMKNPAAGSEVP